MKWSDNLMIYEGIMHHMYMAMMDGWMDGWLDGWLDGWTDGWMNG
jgi:hypothetical protein